MNNKLNTYIISIILTLLFGSLSLKGQNLLQVDGNGYVQGNLGIGTDNPERNLHILAGHAGGITIQRQIGNAHGIFWKESDGSTTSAINFNREFGDLTFYNGGHNRLFLKSNGHLQLGGLGSAATIQTRLKVNGSFALGQNFDEATPPTNGALIEGRVGIGTISPNTQDELHVFDNDRSRITSETSTNLSAGFRSKTSTAELFAGAISNRYSIYNNNTGQEQLSILPDGKTGIGEINPKANLHVSGGDMIIAPSSSFGHSEILLAENNIGNTGTIIKHDLNFGLDIMNVVNGTRSSPVVNIAPSAMTVNMNSSGHVLSVKNTSTSSSSKGLLVDLNVSNLHPNNQYITFAHRNKVRGKIHGQETLTTLSRDLINDLLGDDPVEDDDTAASTSRTQSASGSNNGILSFISSNYGQELLWHTAEFIESIIILIANSFSILDPDDFAACSYGVISQGIKLWVFIAVEELTAGIAYESEGADYAEWLPKANPDEIISAGEVVGVIGGKISKYFDDASKFMVISHHPMVLGNMPSINEEDNFEKVAFIGQVPVKVIGDVSIGDYILPSGNKDGFAQAVSPNQMKTKDYSRIIGIAWEKSDTSKIINVINTAVGINANDLSNTVSQMQYLINQLQLAVQKIDPSFNANLFVVDREKNIDFQNDHSRSSSLLSEVKLFTDLDQRSISAVENKRRASFNSIYVNLEDQGFDFGYFPQLKKMLKNPTIENIIHAEKHYSNVLSKLKGILPSLSN